MGSSFTEFRGYGFWARDGLLTAWLQALVDVIPGDRPAWLHEVAQDWDLQARHMGGGCLWPGLDDHLTSPDRVAAVLALVPHAYDHLAKLAGPTGHVPASWLQQRRPADEASWWRDLDMEYVRQISDTFAALSLGEVTTTAETSPVLPKHTQTSSSFTG